MTRNELLAYAAGVIDGEGCISINRAGHNLNYYNASLIVAMRDVEAVQVLCQLWGVPMRFWRANRMYAFCPQPCLLTPILLEVEPFLQIKHKQSKVVREFLEHKAKRRYNRSYPPGESVLAYRKQLWQQCALLKRLGRTNILSSA